MSTIVAKLYDLASNELADISTIALEKSMTVAHNGARQFTIQAPSGDTLLTSTATDGYRNLRKGNRKLLVWEDGTIIFHGRVFAAERVGDGTVNRVTITAFDPFMELGFDPDKAGRVVRSSTGNFVTPTFTGTGSGGAGVISGPDLIKQVLTNSGVTGTETPGPGGEGPLPIDLTTGTFDLDIPPAVDLSAVDTMDWPIMVGDFITTLVNTGVCDIFMRPLDPSEAVAVATPYLMVALSAVSTYGTDKTSTVHFDYWTGSNNASGARHLEDFSTICNKLYDYLGPRNASGQWINGNITPGTAGTTIDPTASRALYGGTGSGQFMSIRIFDSVGAASRPLYIALWNAEQGYRVEPRDLLYITPAPGSAGLYTAPQDFDVGDLITINIGADLGLALAESQRVYGYSKVWDRQGVARLSELVTSADVTI